MKKFFFATILLFLGLGHVWGAASTSTDGKYVTSTINFSSVGSLSASTNYWYNGVKFYCNNSQSVKATSSSWSTSVSQPAYISDITAGKNTNATNKWGSDGSDSHGVQYTMSGLTCNQFALGVHVNQVCTVVVVVDKNIASYTDEASITASVDATAYGTNWTSSTYKTAGTALTVTSSRAAAATAPGRYTLRIPITTSGEKVVKIFNNSEGSGAGKLFCFESILIETAVTHTLTNVTKTSGATKDTLGTVYNAVFAAADGYKLPSTITVTIGGSAATAGTDYTWNSSTGAFQVPAAKVTGAIAVTITGEEAAPTWYTLSYDANGGTGSMPSHEFISGTTVNAAQNTSFTPPSGKIFKCWNTKANGSGTSYAEGASFTLSANTTLYAQWITASTSGTYCISMYNLNVSDQMKYFTYSGSSDMQILDLEVPNYKTSTNNFWVGKNGSWYDSGLGNSNAKSANERLEDLCLKGNRSVKLGTGSQGVLARFFVYDNSTYNNLYIEFTPKQYSLIWGKDGSSWSPVKLYPSGYENEWTSEVVTLTSEQISSYKYYVGILKADDGVAYWYKSNTSTVGSMGTYNKTTDTWGSNVSTLSAGAKGFFRMWQDATGYDNWRCHFVPVYTFSYNANGGSGAPATIYFASEGDENHRKVYISDTEPTRTGYTFAGWATSSAGASAGTVDYEVGDAITISADTELFAVWNCITPDAPTAAKISASDQCQGTGVTFSANTTGLPSYVTWYWQTAADGTSTTYPASSNYTTSTSAGTYTMYLRAKNTACGEWSNSASTPSKSATVYAGTTITTQPTTSVTGHVGVDFTLGSTLAATGAGTLTYQWYSYTSSGGAGEATVGSATTTKTLTTSKSVGTYYYKVEVIGTCGSVKSSMITVTVDNKHLLSYNANSGSGAPSGDYYAPSASVTLNSTTIPTRSGYVFLGWNTNSSGTGTMYQPGATYTMPSTATTLYAAWGSPCFSFSKGTKGTEPVDGFVMTPSNINSSAFTAGATLSGGNLTNTSGATLGINADRGFVMVKSTRELTLTLTGGQFQAGTVIALEGYTNKSSSSKTYGFSVSGNAAGSPITESTNAYVAIKQRYVVSAGDGIEGTSVCTITMNSAATGSQTYLSALYIGNCVNCTPITPTLTYDNTAIWVGESVATPTLNKDGSTGSVTYASSNTDAATVNESTGVVTAVAHGTTTITATIDADGTHCGNTVSCNITVKTMDCGNNVIASATRKSGSKTEMENGTGVAYGSAGYNGQADGKLGSDGHYMYITLSGTYLQSGDVVVINVSAKNQGGIYLYAGTTSPGTQIGTIAAASVVVGDNEITLSNVPASTSSVTMYRADGNQNHKVEGIKVKRYTCPDTYVYDDASANGLWGTAGNWISATGRGAGLPTIADRAVIKKPVTVDIVNAQASEVMLDQSSTNTGSLEINAGKELAVAQTVKVWDGSNRIATTVNDIVINSTSSAGLGALVMGSHDGTNKATVNFTTRSKGIKDDNTSIAQYVGTPFNDENNILYNWYNSWVYGITYDGSNNIDWERVNEGTGMTPFRGYCVFSADGANHVYWEQGTLNASTTQTISGLNWQSGAGTANLNNENLLANSWMAPIYIKAMQSSDFVNADATVYIFNSTSASAYESGGFAGNYSSYTVNTAEDVIPAMQSFSVFTTGTGASITLDYSRIVYDPAVAGTAVPVPNKVISRERKNDNEANKLRIFVRTESGLGDILYMWEREDFSEAFENGWDGRKMYGESYAPQLYAITTDGAMAVNCVPTYEGVLIGFRAGTDEQTYTFSFEYDADAEPLYLYDKYADVYTRVLSGNTYQFVANDYDAHARFSLTHYMPGVATGMDAVSGQQSAVRCQKILLNERILILRDGKLYDVTGKTVK